MDYTHIITISLGAVVAIIFIIFLTKRSINRYENSAKPSLIKGFSSFFEGDDKKALDELRAIALSDKGSPEIYLSIAFLYRKLGDYTKAAHIHEVLLGNKDIDREYTSLIVTELSKDYLLAEMPLKVIQVLDNNISDNSENLLTYAKAYLMAESFDKAISYYQKYNKVTGKSIYGFTLKCLVEKTKYLTDISKALKIIKSALNEDEFCRPARFAYVALLSKNAKQDKVLKEYKNIILQNLVRDYKDMQVIEKAFIAAGVEQELNKTIKSAIESGIKNPFIFLYMAKYQEKAENKESGLLFLDECLNEKQYSFYLAKEYAIMKNDNILLNTLKDLKPFQCKICQCKFEEYSDTCCNCNSYDSINPI